MEDEPIHDHDTREPDRGADPPSHAHRRRALSILQDVGAPLALADLATEMVRRETADRAGDGRWERARWYHVMLYHRDVPKLTEAGLVEFDTDLQTVAPVAPAAEIEAAV